MFTKKQLQVFRESFPNSWEYNDIHPQFQSSGHVGQELVWSDPAGRIHSPLIKEPSSTGLAISWLDAEGEMQYWSLPKGAKEWVYGEKVVPHERGWPCEKDVDPIITWEGVAGDVSSIIFTYILATSRPWSRKGYSADIRVRGETVKVPEEFLTRGSGIKTINPNGCRILGCCERSDGVVIVTPDRVLLMTSKHPFEARELLVFPEWSNMDNFVFNSKATQGVGYGFEVKDLGESFENPMHFWFFDGYYIRPGDVNNVWGPPPVGGHRSGYRVRKHTITLVYEDVSGKKQTQAYLEAVPITLSTAASYGPKFGINGKDVGYAGYPLDLGSTNGNLPCIYGFSGDNYIEGSVGFVDFSNVGGAATLKYMGEELPLVSGGNHIGIQVPVFADVRYSGSEIYVVGDLALLHAYSNPYFRDSGRKYVVPEDYNLQDYTFYAEYMHVLVGGGSFDYRPGTSRGGYAQRPVGAVGPVITHTPNILGAGCVVFAAATATGALRLDVIIKPVWYEYSATGYTGGSWSMTYS